MIWLKKQSINWKNTRKQLNKEHNMAKKDQTIWEMADELAKLTVKTMSKKELKELADLLPDLSTPRKIHK